MRSLKIYQTISLIALLLFINGCSKRLDDPVPDTSVGSGQLKASDVGLVINGMYKKMLGDAMHQPYVVFDVYSDDIISTQGGSPTQFNPVAYDNNDPLVEDGYGNLRYYSKSYGCISMANFIINYIRKANDPSLGQYLGEALAARAYSYLLLAQAYGGVVITSGDGDEPVRAPKSPEEEVFALVEKDLLEAIPLLGSYTTSNSISKESATLFLARYYLNSGNHSEAGRLAMEVIGSSAVSLNTTNFVSNYLFNNAGNTEVLFRVSDGPVAAAYDRGGLFTFYSPANPFAGPSGGTGNGQTWMDPALVALYETNDVRKKLIREQYSVLAGTTVSFLMKFSADTAQVAGRAFYVYPLARLSEAYLIAAEAKARQGVVDVTYYNAVRQARNASVKTNADFTSPGDFLDELEAERRREFVGEGMRWQDMRRFGKAIPFLASKGKNATRIYLPFPSSERGRNPLLIQNEGY